MPASQKTALVNKVIAYAIEEIEREENGQKFLKMLATIKPVKTAYSSEQMVRMLREGKLDDGKLSLSSMIEANSGSGLFESVEDIDSFLKNLREEWD